ncbi:MAG: bactofilin family protein [Thermoanaerobaculia bacterium]
MARSLTPFLLSILLAGATAAAAEPVVVAAGEIRSGDVVALGREAHVDGVLRGTLVTIGGDVRIAGRIEKDVVALGGDVVLEPGAAVGGDVLVLGGEVRASDSGPAPVGGRLLTVGALEAAFAAELRTSPLGVRPVRGLLLAFRLALLFGWLIVGLALLRLVPRPLTGAAGLVPGRLTAVTAIGAAAVLAALLVSAVLLLVLPASAGLLVAGLLVAALGVAKAFGLAAVFVALGRRLTRGAGRGSPLFGDPSALAVGLALLGGVSLVPVAGPFAWSVASLLGIGTALAAAAAARPRSAAF